MQERFPFEMPPEITEQPAPVEETPVQPEPVVKPVVEDEVVEEKNTPLPDAEENCNGSGEVKEEPEPVKEETPKQELIAEEVREEPVIENVENEVVGQDINQEQEQPLPAELELEEAAIDAKRIVEERGDDNNEPVQSNNEDNKMEEEVAPIVEEQVNEREENGESLEKEDASESGPMELENDNDDQDVEDEGERLDIGQDEDNSEEQGMEVEDESDNSKGSKPNDMDNQSDQNEREEKSVSNRSDPGVREEEIKKPSIEQQEEMKVQEVQVNEEREPEKQEEEPAPVVEQPEPESKKSSVQAKEEEIVEEPQLAKREEIDPVKEPSEQEEEIEEEPEPVSVKSVRFDNLRAHTLRHLKKRVLNTPSRVVYEPDSVINRNYFKQSSVSHIPPQTYKGEPTTKQLSLNKLKQEVTSLYKARRMGVPVPAVYSINLKQRVLCTEIFTNTESLANYLRTKVDFSNENVQKELKKVFNKLGEYLAELHNGNVIHGNLNNEAVLVSATSQRLKFVDFSESYSSGNIEDKAKDLYKFEQSLLGGKQDNAVVGELMQFLCTGYITKSKKFDSIIQRLRKIKLRSGN